MVEIPEIQAPKKKLSPIWDYFTLAEDERFAMCTKCEQKISRGGKDTKMYGTTNLTVHLRAKHTESHAELEKKVKEQKELKEAKEKMPRCESHRQLSLMENGDRVWPWWINDERAQRIHRYVGLMIAVDCQPFSTVDDEGFVGLITELEPRYTLPSRKYFTENVIANIYKDLKEKVSGAVNSIKYFSFTTDDGQHV